VRVCLSIDNYLQPLVEAGTGADATFPGSAWRYHRFQYPGRQRTKQVTHLSGSKSGVAASFYIEFDGSVSSTLVNETVNSVVPRPVARRRRQFYVLPANGTFAPATLTVKLFL
jgi:hypothetical protein